EAEEGQGAAFVYVASEGRLMGAISLSGKIKKEAAQAISVLKKNGVVPVMVTGDSEKAALWAAKECGIEEVFARVSPQGKADIVAGLKEKGQVAFIGDGINDAPALSAADTGIAIGAGADIALESADIVLMRSGITDFLGAYFLSKKTYAKVKQNLFWAFIYNVIGIPVAALGLLNPMIAGTAMALSSVSVVVNSLLLRK
ncbi:MAG TPA: HAD family hydrolase, partial [bacterium]|nr:HAD family hydrolase [bacterium]